MKKDDIISKLISKNWASKSMSELSKCRLSELREILYNILMQKGMQQEVQQLKQYVLEKQKYKLEKNTQLKNTKCQIFEKGTEYLIPGAPIGVFNIKNNKENPIRARVISQENEGKKIQIKFLQTEIWNEAGGHTVEKGDCLFFIFEPITCKWLRDGLTAEVVRSFDSKGKSRYFELSFTRQYLVF